MSSIQPNSAWNVIYVAASLPEAHVVSGRLEVEGVPSWISHEPIGTVYGITGGKLGEVRVLVRPEDYDLALQILESEPAETDDDLLLDDTDDDNEMAD